MIFMQPGKKSMTSGEKINAFLTARKKIYDQQEKNVSRSNPDIVVLYRYITGHPGYVVNARQFL